MFYNKVIETTTLGGKAVVFVNYESGSAIRTRLLFLR